MNEKASMKKLFRFFYLDNDDLLHCFIATTEDEAKDARQKLRCSSEIEEIPADIKAILRAEQASNKPIEKIHEQVQKQIRNLRLEQLDLVVSEVKEI